MHRSSRAAFFLLVAWAVSGPFVPAFGGPAWLKQLGKNLETRLKDEVLNKYVKFDQQQNVLSFSPAFMKLAADKARKNYGESLQSFDLAPEGKALHFAFAMKTGAKVAANIEPEAIELGKDEMAIVGLLPQGLKIEGVDFQKSVSGFFDNLFGSSPATAPADAAAPAPAPAPPAGNGPSLSVNDLLSHFTVEGNRFRMKRPMKDSTLGRALASARPKPADGQPATATQRLNLTVENG